MLKNIFCLSLVIIITICEANGQSFGGNKWDQQWQQFEAEDIRVIYPVGYDDQASRVFSIVTYLQNNHRETIGVQTDKISLVLNNLTNISNGYVGLAPFRSEFYTTPSQNNFRLGSLPWLDLLTIHEYRHVLQLSNGRKGISKLFSILFGQSAYAGAINLAVPNWYLEGDAVLAETSMSAQGRGRIPHFLRAYKAYEAAGTRFSYGKIRNGSFKDFIPDHYRIGYMMNKYGADQYGSSFWPGVLADAGSYKGLFYPFSNAIKRRSGHTTSTLYHATLDHYKSSWEQDNKYPATKATPILSTGDKVFTNYRLPHFDDQGSLYYLKSGLADIQEVWKKEGQISKKLFAMGVSNDIYFDINGGKISWSELRFHPSRGNIDYSVIMTYDLTTSEKTQVSTRTRYFSPSVHPDGKVMAVVDIDQFGHSVIKIISCRDGLVLDSLANDLRYFITYPKWSADGETIFFSARNPSGQMAVCSQNLSSKEIAPLSNWSFKPIGVPAVNDKYIYYSRSSDDAEHIYRVPTNGSRIEEKVIQSQFGAYQPIIKNDTIVYSQFTAAGLQLVKSIPDQKLASQPKTNTVQEDPTYQAYGGNILTDLPESSGTNKKYGRLNRAINLHSWGITANDQTAAFLLQSENILNSVSLSGGLQYIFDDQRSIWTAGAKFGFTYPNLTARYTLESRETVVTQDSISRLIDFDDHNLSLGIELPLNLTSGVYLRSLLPYFAIERRSFKGSQIRDFSFNTLRFGFIFLNKRLKAPRDVLAKYSQYININYQNSISNEVDGNQFDLESEFSLPGFLKSHAIRVELDYSRQLDNTYSSRFDQARGYTDIRADRKFRLGLNYHMPILYPEFGIGGMAYLQRIQSNIFYDISRLSGNGNTIGRSSYGVELLFDLNFLNTLPVTLGTRYVHTVTGQGNFFEFFIPFYRF